MPRLINNPCHPNYSTLALRLPQYLSSCGRRQLRAPQSRGPPCRGHAPTSFDRRTPRGKLLPAERERHDSHAEEGFFNTFMGEFNFADLPEAELMRSIRLFGEKVMPALRDYEPF